MNKLFACLVVLIVLLTGCNGSPPQYKKVHGEIIGKYITHGRFGPNYHVKVSYPVGSKYAIDDLYVEKEEYDSYNIKDKLNIYANENGVGEITKE